MSGTKQPRSKKPPKLPKKLHLAIIRAGRLAQQSITAHIELRDQLLCLLIEAKR